MPFKALIDEAEHIVESVADALDDGAEELRDAFSSTALQNAIKAALAGLEMYPVYPDDFILEISVVKITFTGIKGRIHMLKGYADNPPEGREQILDFIFTFAPSSVEIREGVSFAPFGVETDLFGFKVVQVFKGESVQEMLDHLLDKAGIE